MRAKLDLHVLCRELRQAEEREPQFDEELNPYLLHTILPRLGRGETVKLKEIDLSAFDTEDPNTILEYFGWKENLKNDVHRLTGRLCDQNPVPVKTRGFL